METRVRTIAAHEARTHFSKLLREVERGETFVITRYGVPVARLEPIRKHLEDAATAIDESRQHRRENHITLGDGGTIEKPVE